MVGLVVYLLYALATPTDKSQSERIRVPVWYRSDSHTALTNAALLGPGDVAIGLSHSGRTREVIETLAEAADHGALTVAVTSFGRIFRAMSCRTRRSP